MKKIDISTFVYKITDEVREFEESQISINPEATKTMQEWVNNFLIYCGYEEENEEEFESIGYEDDFYYEDAYGYQDVVNRKKYRSFRDDDGY